MDRRILRKVLDAYAEQEGKRSISVIEVISRLQQKDSSICETKLGPKDRRVPTIVGVGVGEAGRELKIEQKVVDQVSGTIEMASTTVGQLYNIASITTALTTNEQPEDQYEGRPGVLPDYAYEQFDDDDDEI